MTDLGTGTEPRTVADVLEAAAKYLEEHGWTQDVFVTYDGCACAVGAIRLAAGGGRHEDDETHIQTNYLSSTATAAVSKRLAPVSSLLSWNDEPDRTADEVITLLREVAAAERGA